jgi:hypothetical protein
VALTSQTLRRVAVVVLLAVAAIAGIVDAAANARLVSRHAAALLVLGCLVLMLASLGVASAHHRALLINTLLAAGSVTVAHLAFAVLIAG